MFDFIIKVLVQIDMIPVLDELNNYVFHHVVTTIKKECQRQKCQLYSRGWNF